jgi:hypothetical protein
MGGEVGFGAVRTNAHDAGPGAARVFEVRDAADPGQQQGGHLGAADDAGDGFDPFQVGMCAEAVDAAGSAQTVAVRDFDGVHARAVQRLGDGGGLFDGVLVTHGMHAIAQGDVADVEAVNHDGAPMVSLA